MTADLTSHNGEPIILSDKLELEKWSVAYQIGTQDAHLRYTTENGVYWRLSAIEKDTFWCSFMFILYYN